MKAILIDKPGGPEVMRLGETGDPTPGPGELLVRVHAAGVNRADVLQRQGRYPPPLGASDILGLELAGEVIETGDGTRKFHTGDRVMALVTGGAYAELATVSEATALPVPDNLDWTEAAAIPEAYLTAWCNLFDLGGLQAGESVLIHAAASGVGSAAIQLAKALCTTIYAVAGNEAKAELCLSLGADTVIDRSREDFAEVILGITDGVDLVLDFVGAPNWDRNLKTLRRGGRLTLVGFLGGSRGDIDLGPVLRKTLIVKGTTLRGMRLEDKGRLVEAFGRFALERLGDGRLRPVVDSTFPLADAGDAHIYMEENRNAGKIVLRIR